MVRRMVLVVVVAVSATLAGLAVYTDAAVRQAEAAYPPVGAFVTVDGLRLHYLDRGAGPPVALVHGSDGVLQDYTTTILDAVAHDYRAIAVDRPGHGHSERPPGEPLTLAEGARLLHALLRVLGVERPLLVGHSYGGAVALRYALDYPDDLAGLVLLAPAAYPSRGLPHPRVVLPGIPLLGPLYLHMLLVPLEYRAAPAPDPAAPPGAAPVPAYQEVARALGARPGQYAAYADEIRRVSDGLAAQAPRYGEIAAPVVMLAGAADLATPLDRHAQPLHAALPNARLVVLPDTGHWVHHAHPEVTLAAIREAWEVARR